MQFRVGRDDVKHTSQIYPGRAAHDPTGSINERLRAYTRARNLRLQTTAIRSETSKRVQQQVKEASPKPLFRDAGMQSSEDRARAWPDNQRHELAGPRRRVSGQNRHTGRRHRSQESRAALGKRERGQSRSGSLNVVDKRIALRRWPSGSHSSMQAQGQVEVPPQQSGHGDVWRSLTPNCGRSNSRSR